MTDDSKRILIIPGKRMGFASFSNDADFKAKLADGFEVFALLRGAYFSVVTDGDGLKFTFLREGRPAGL